MGSISKIFSFDLIAALPIEQSFGAWAGLFAAAFFPAYIAYAKQSVKRRFIYASCACLAAAFAIILFAPVEDFYFDRGTITIGARTFGVLIALFACLDRFDKTLPFKKKGWRKRFIKHPLESLAAHAAYLLFKLLPAEWASATGGFAGRWLGVFQRGYNRLAMANLDIAFPKMPLLQKVRIRRAMWGMMGRYASEPAHFREIYHNHGKYLDLLNDAVLDRLAGRPFVAFIAHSGSVGLISIPFALHNTPCSIIYKFPSNNLMNNLTTKSFGRGIGRLGFIPNDAKGTKAAMRVLGAGGAVLVVPDQRLEGVWTRFFGRKAETAIGAAKLARHFGCPLLPIQIVRVKGMRHKIIFHKPFMPLDDDKATMQKISGIIEGWVRERPEQWFWVHDRWGIKHDATTDD